MVLYGAVSDTSIGYLFMGGVIPGLMLAAAQSGVVTVLARYKDFPVEPVPKFRESVISVVHAIPVLCLPAILLGGIYSGAVTPTEAAAVAAFCALVLAFFWYRTLSLAGFYRVLVTSSKATSIVAITIAGALVMNWIVAAEQLPEVLGHWMVELNLAPALFMFVVTILFLVLGAFLDTLLMLLIIIPILMPTVLTLGIDPVHFGVVSVVNLMIGLVTPPMGELVFLIAGVSGIKVVDITKELWPFLIVLITLLFVLVYVPQLTLWLPETMGYQVQGDFMR
jgi:tripartite ATP-independent transporter DctM subunit